MHQHRRHHHHHHHHHHQQRLTWAWLPCVRFVCCNFTINEINAGGESTPRSTATRCGSLEGIFTAASRKTGRWDGKTWLCGATTTTRSGRSRTLILPWTCALRCVALLPSLLIHLCHSTLSQHALFRSMSLLLRDGWMGGWMATARRLLGCCSLSRCLAGYRRA
jgi:hypothetical protein